MFLWLAAEAMARRGAQESFGILNIMDVLFKLVIAI
jgi:hypothetical protein